MMPNWVISLLEFLKMDFFSCTHVVYLVKEEEERLEFDTVKRVTMKAWARTTSWAIFTKKFNWNYNVRQACGGLWVEWSGVNIDG